MAKPPAKGAKTAAKARPSRELKAGFKARPQPKANPEAIPEAPAKTPSATSKRSAKDRLPKAVPEIVASAGLAGTQDVAPAGEGSPQAGFRLITLKRRSEFLRVRKGQRSSTPGFVLEGMARASEAPRPAVDGARFGFTIARKVGKAVERNRIRRRLKAAIVGAAAARARREFDYVVIARRAALTLPFGVLVADLIDALQRIHRSARRGRPETGNTPAG